MACSSDSKEGFCGVLPWTSCTAIAGPDADPANSVMSFFAEEVPGSGFVIYFTLIVLLLTCLLKVGGCVVRVLRDTAKEGLSLSWFGSVILLENVRFHVEEEEKGVDKDGNKFKADAEAVKVFRSSFAKLDDAFCSDAFGTAHRAHSSMMGDGFPVECSGFLVAKELDAFAKVLDKAAKLVLASSGGAKVSDKISMRTTMIPSWWWRLAATKAMCAVTVLEELLCRSTSVCTIWTTASLTSATLDRASTPCRPGENTATKW